MGTLTLGIIIAAVFVLVRAATSGSLGSPSAIAQRGIPARGILLQVSSVPGRTVGIAPWRFQPRSVVMDIEIPGRPPYQAAVTPFVPTHLVRDVLPGATVELRMNPKNPLQIVIVGPGVGFNSALLNAGAGQGTS